MAGFGEAMAAVDAAIESSLTDGSADFLASNGTLQRHGLAIMLDKEVERFDQVGGGVSRAVTISVRIAALGQYDRQGAFKLDSCQWGADGKTWHLDGIVSDDGAWITFYVVP
ncbi:hypothetical protein BVH01_16065 [Pseudomonas sp. PA1(2017)]|uniref:hypothetical protein n=1 Tax=Pseudomonas sp. PA1(2017) TaxID=1932113 RepID=UPI000960B2FC|nr:hypothetical protein [Pseudomonas sp. PA1(2017)]OLU15334.1 hypothetical protein BVH01_16065 [Pseudomonas sp. PA1(2017)]